MSQCSQALVTVENRVEGDRGGTPLPRGPKDLAGGLAQAISDRHSRGYSGLFQWLGRLIVMASYRRGLHTSLP